VAGILPIELKATESIHPVFVAQTLNYLRALQQPLGLIINFNAIVLKDGIRRVIITR
jgi:iron complex transport system substrate-binding protein